MSHCLLRRTGLAVVLCLPWLASPEFVRADNLDKELMTQAAAIFKVLQARKCQNVGVLKFMVKVGKGEPSFNAGALNHNLAARLENALILANDADHPLGIIRDATSVALGQAPKATYGTAAGREALFKVNYPLAWGKEKVSADAFLTGMVELSPDMQTTTVNIAYFNRNAAKLEELTKFSVKTDRNILADSGQSFALAKRCLQKRGAIEELEAEAAKAAAALQNGEKPTSADGPQEPTTLFSLAVYADGKHIESKRDPANHNRHKLQGNLASGQQIELRVKNQLDEKLGVVLKVNGLSTINKEEYDMNQCTRWILEPKGEYAVRGFYMDDGSGGTNLEQFRVTEDGDFGPRAGFIDLAFFRNGPPPEGNDLQFSLRGLVKRSAGAVATPANLAAAKQQIRDLSSLKPRAILTGDGTLKPVVLKTDKLDYPHLAGNGHLEYNIK